MSKLTHILLIFIITGCGVGPQQPLQKGLKGTYELYEYAFNIIPHFPKHPKYKLPPLALVDKIEGKEIPLKAVGLCRFSKHTGPLQILIKKDTWNSFNKEWRIALLAHELVHCMYGLAHTSTGLMGPTVGQSWGAINLYGLTEAVNRALKSAPPLFNEGASKHNCNHKH